MTDPSPATNVAELLTRSAASDGAGVALVDGDRRVTWAWLEDEVDRLARGLSTSGLVAGHRVGISMVNSIEFVASYLAVLRGGMVAVPVNPTAATGEVARVLADSGARMCFADRETVASVRGAVGGIADALAGPRTTALESAVVPTVIVTGMPALPGETSYAAIGDSDATLASPRDPESLAVVLYTTGTSGHPRGAMLSHRALLANVHQAAATDPQPIRPDDVVLGVLPLFGVYGLNAILGQVLLQGATLVLGRRPDPAETLELVASQHVTCVPVAPPVIVAWSQRDDIGERLHGVRIVLSGAGPLAEELVVAFAERTGLRVQQGYGLTEAGPIVTTTVGTAEPKAGSTGRAVPGVEVRVLDEDGNQVIPDDPGEIWIRGANAFSGYWPSGDGAPGADGWLATGDVGFLDREGDLFLLDRLTELVVVSGFNVYPSEIEDVINEVEGVSAAAVIGLPDPTTGEAVVAYVLAAHAGPADRTALAERVRVHCGRRLARFKVPTLVEVVDDLPRLESGEVAKARLRTAARRSVG